MIIKGYNGFPDFECFEFENTDNPVILHNEPFQCVKCTKIGTVFNLWTYATTNKARMDLINPTNESSWVKAFDGIYISKVEYSYNEGTLENIYVRFAVRGVEGQHYDYTPILKSFSVDNGYCEYALEPNRYQRPPVMAFARYNYKKTWDTEPNFIFGIGCAWFFGCTVGGYPHGSVGYLNGNIFKINKEQYLDFPETYPAISPANIALSSDSQETWYLGNSPFDALMSWEGYAIDTPQEADNSVPDGGDGNYNNETSDTVPFDNVPSISAISSGFVKIYHPTPTELLQFRNFLYSADFIDNVKKLISDPLQYVISLMLNATRPTDTTSEYIGAGGVSSEVSSAVVSSQYKVFDCGSVNIEECYGGFLDYDNMTQVRMYLPFCGEIVLDTNIVMHSTISLKYAVDYLTGDCMARIHVQNNHGVNGEFYFKEGNCACQIPMSGANYSSFYTQGFRALMGMGATLGGNPSGVIDSADAVASMRVERQRVGSISGEHGFLGNYTPYVVIERPTQSFPSGLNSLNGRPSNIGGTVGSFSGYTEIESIKLNGIKATDAEIEEIKQLLSYGVYI